MEPIDPGGAGDLVVYAKDQPEYADLPCRRDIDGRVRTRWTLTTQERLAIANGADLELGLLTFGDALQPIDLGLTNPNAGAACPLCLADWTGSLVAESGKPVAYAAWRYACGTSVTVREDGTIIPAQTADCLRRAMALEAAAAAEGSPA